MSPIDLAIYNQGSTVVFNAEALDLEDLDLSYYVTWESDVDGYIGTGHFVTYSTSFLSPGMHIITATIVDSGGLVTREKRRIQIDAVSGQLMLKQFDILTLNTVVLESDTLKYASNEEWIDNQLVLLGVKS